MTGDTVNRSSDLAWYRAEAARTYTTDNRWYSVWRFAEAAAVGDLVWFRDLQGRFYLAELLSPWRYDLADEEINGADLVNHRKARIVEVGFADAVPGKVIACFRPSRTFQAIDAPGMLTFSEELAGLPLSSSERSDIYEFMSDEDLENLVLVYLQHQGWYVLPGTRSTTTAHYECVLVGHETGERAIYQVKSGGTSVDAASYAAEEKAFLFAASGKYGKQRPGNVVFIEKAEINRFMRDVPHLLPRAVSTWIRVAGLPPL